MPGVWLWTVTLYDVSLNVKNIVARKTFVEKPSIFYLVALWALLENNYGLM
jgi:hypothetical protein